MKRYIAEMENDFERIVRSGHADDGEKERTVLRLQRVRNTYICGLMTELDAARSLIGIINEFDWGEIIS